MTTIHEAARETPVRGTWDVVVAGGGLGGVAAALAAARAGASTLLVERNGFLGGVATAGMCCSIFNCYYTSSHQLGSTGIAVEIADALATATGYGTAWHRHKGHVIYDIELAKQVLETLLERAGVEILLGALVADAIVNDGRVDGIVIEGKGGREALLAACTVDATGDADVAALAGAPLILRHPDPMHLHSLCFRLGNVDTDAFMDVFRRDPDQYPAFMDVAWTFDEALAQYDECGTFLFPHGGGMQMRVFQEARSEGVLPASVGIYDTTDACQMHALRQTRCVHVITGFCHFDGLETAGISRAILDGRLLAFTVAAAYRRFLPGFENAFVMGVAANLGVRTSRRIEGELAFSRELAVPGQRFPDAIGRCVAYHHEVRHPGKNAWSAQVMSAGTFDVPLGCLIPKAIDGLIMGAGRSTSVDEAWLLRAMVATMVVGQGAGVTAAVCARAGQVPRAVDKPAVQSELQRQGVCV